MDFSDVNAPGTYVVTANLGPRGADATVTLTDRDVRIYLRPEDVLARPIAEGDPHVFDASIEKIEFLGSYCHVKVASPALDSHKLTVYLSLNFLSEQSLQVGSPLRLKLLPERIKVF